MLFVFKCVYYFVLRPLSSSLHSMALCFCTIPPLLSSPGYKGGYHLSQSSITHSKCSLSSAASSERPSKSLGEHSPSLGLRTLRLRLWAESGWYCDLLDDAVTSTQMMLLIRVAVAVVTGDVMEGGWEDGYY